MMQLGQGGLANSAGHTLETTVIGTLESKGFRTLQYREWVHQPTLYDTELLLHNVPYTTLYGHPVKTEFLIRSQKYNLEIHIKCK
jgi:hypothetical protein